MPTRFERIREHEKKAAVYRTLYRTACLPDQEWQRAKLEALRYKWRYRATDIRVLQRLHDHWKEYATFVAMVYLFWMMSRYAGF